MARRSNNTMQPVIIIAVLVVTCGSMPADPAGPDCGPTPLGQREGWSGFRITADEQTTTVFFVPEPRTWSSSHLGVEPGLFFTFEGILEELARRAKILPVFAMVPPVCSAVQTPTSWSGGSSLDVLRKVLEDCDLTVSIQGSFAIVAYREMIQRTGVLLSIGPIAGNALPQNVEEALYRDLYLHDFPLRNSHFSHALYAVRIGYLPVPDDPNEFIVFAGTLADLGGGSFRVFRARIVGGQDPSVQCQWVEWPGGSPCDFFKEDIDGDGVQDILIDRRGLQISIRDEMVPSTIVSARNGRELFSFILGKIAIQRTQGGPTRISALTRDAHISGEPCLPVFEFSSTSGKYERVSLISGPDTESPACTNAAERLATTWDGPTNIAVYDLHQCETSPRSRYMSSVEMDPSIEAGPAWAFSKHPFHIRGSEIVVEETVGSRTMLAYLPSEYVEAIMATD